MKKTKLPRVLAVIPARGGSKRLPGKNVIEISGHPLIAHTIMAAQRATLLTDWLVSSEDEEIIKIARSYGAPVPFVRPTELAEDDVESDQVVMHALLFMEDKNKASYDLVMLLHPTSPIRDPKHIDEAIRLLSHSDLPTLASVKGPFKKNKPTLKRIRNKVMEGYCSEANLAHPEGFYIYNASIYAAKRDYFVKNKKLFSEKQVPFLMDAIHSIDVDEMHDLVIAGACMRHIKKQKENEMA